MSAKAQRRLIIARDRAAIQAAVDPWDLAVSSEAWLAEHPQQRGPAAEMVIIDEPMPEGPLLPRMRRKP